jgi:hypothetical protein
VGRLCCAKLGRGERRNSKRKERLKRRKTNDLNNKKTDNIEINK